MMGEGMRIARIRVFDPACGSGNFLVIAYKEMREIEAEINRRRGEADLGRIAKGLRVEFVFLPGFPQLLQLAAISFNGSTIPE